MNVIKNTTSDLKSYLLNRFIEKPHYLNTRLEKGQYHEIDKRMLHGLFETLVDFIEVEKAWMQTIIDNIHVPWYKKITFRDPTLGIKHLKWEMDLKPEEDGSPGQQAISAKEQLELYTWWKEVRPKRVMPFEDGVDMPWDLVFNIEDQYHEADTQMLIRLIKIRSHLWS